MLKIEPVRRYIEINGTIYEILDNKSHKMKKEFGYEHENYIYIYGGKVKNKKDLNPGYCYKIDDQIIYVEHHDHDKELYNIERVLSISNNKIIENINNNENFKEINRNLLDSSDEYFAPEILPTDNILKILIKKVLKKKKINLKSLRDKFKNDYDISNMKGALLKPGPMSIMYAQKWVELLGAKLTLICEFEDCFGDIVEEKEIL